ncbi:MAG TPA: hypothetical protein PK156_18570 [Polyangium sp.]|nr:hypothetical protein [Polyangium sp.]
MRTFAALFSSMALATMTFATSAQAQNEAWSDRDPRTPAYRHPIGPVGIRGGAEYRANALYVNPIAPNSESGRRIGWIEHRLRLDLGLDYRDKVRIQASADVLDGALWGDNGTLFSGPRPNFGSNVNARSPNIAIPCVTQRGDNPLKADSYGYGLCSQEQVRFRKLYGDVSLPFGLLRVGRQSANTGTGVQAADGEGRPNRFGFSRQGNLVDRILFATKPLEAFKPKEEVDTSEDHGMILALAYDRWVTDDVHLFGDDVQQFDVAVRYMSDYIGPFRDFFIGGYFVHRWDTVNASSINSFGGRLLTKIGDFHISTETAANVGSTKEISEAYKYITNDPVVAQNILQVGSRTVVRYDKPRFSAYLELDYASGDDNPTNRTPLTQFVFAEDANVGLLLFEHVLSYQTARVAAASNELIRRLGATSFPTDSIWTRGAFTNAVAFFPQMDVRPAKGLLIRGGALFAWAAAPVADPVASLQARDGNSVTDDLVNFNGGKPGNYWGTELDARISYRYLDHFLFDLEGAILFPGDALRNADGYAARSVLVQGRTSFYF